MLGFKECWTFTHSDLLSAFGLIGHLLGPVTWQEVHHLLGLWSSSAHRPSESLGRAQSFFLSPFFLQLPVMLGDNIHSSPKFQTWKEGRGSILATLLSHLRKSTSRTFIDRRIHSNQKRSLLTLIIISQEIDLNSCDISRPLWNENNYLAHFCRKQIEVLRRREKKHWD